MNITRLDLTSFGKFSNYTIDFSEGFNLVYGRNEDGKTTIMDFLIMMFYGHRGRKSSPRENPRLRYQPWQGHRMGGRVFFTYNNKDYRLERFFEKSNSSDDVKLYDDRTGQAIKLSKEPGEDFFDMSEETFKESLIISFDNRTLTADSDTKEIREKLLNIASSGREDLSYDKALGEIKTIKEAMISKSGKKGLIIEKEIQLENLTASLAVARSEEEEKLNYQKELNKLKESIKDLKNDALIIDEKIKELRSYLSEKEEKPQLKLPKGKTKQIFFLLGILLSVLGLFLSKYFFLALAFLVIVYLFLVFISTADKNPTLNYDETEIIHLIEEKNYKQETIHSLEQEKIKIQTLVKERFKGKKNQSQLLNEIGEVQDLLEKLNFDYQALELAEENLSLAFSDIQQDYSPLLNKEVAKILSLLTKEKYKDLRVDEDFNIRLLDNKTGNLVSWEFLSTGTINQSYLALRLALSKLIGKNYPVYFDDVFSSYDQERTLSGLEFLKTYGKENHKQIVFFTCHKNIYQWAKDQGDISLIDLSK